MKYVYTFVVRFCARLLIKIFVLFLLLQTIRVFSEGFHCCLSHAQEASVTLVSNCLQGLYYKFGILQRFYTNIGKSLGIKTIFSFRSSRINCWRYFDLKLKQVEVFLITSSLGPATSSQTQSRRTWYVFPLPWWSSSCLCWSCWRLARPGCSGSFSSLSWRSSSNWNVLLKDNQHLPRTK